ncbi:MAG: class I SAM-dependent DNA methyltransferase [Mycobacterium sp.]
MTLVSTTPQKKPMPLGELEQHLAKAADLLRGSIDQADFKAYIFPLMFFKRLDDVYEEEFLSALEASGGDLEYAGFAENHAFMIPEGARWETVRAHTENVGTALVTAFHAIEAANPDSLYGIFGSTASWTNKQKLPDRKLNDLLDHFSAKPLANSNVSPDVFGRAYEYLIKRFADQSNKKAGEYYTPRSVVRMLVNMLDPKEGEAVYDPACGTGGMLIEVIQHVKDAGGRPELLWGKLFGQEKTLATSAIARMNLLLHGVQDFKIVREDTLRAPAFFTGGGLAKFDCVIANPPFSLKDWGHQAWASDRWGRNKLGGVPPKGYADWAWVQHMFTSAALGTGRVAVVLPQGALFRQGAEGRVREDFLRHDRIEAVIGLAPNLFYGTGLAASVVVLRTQKHPNRAGRVLFINAEKLLRKGRNQNTLETEHADAIQEAFGAFEDKSGFAHVAERDEIEANNWNLNIPLYVTAEQDASRSTLAEAFDELEAAQGSAAASRAALERELEKWGFGA